MSLDPNHHRADSMYGTTILSVRREITNVDGTKFYRHQIDGAQNPQAASR
jgi:hypothetical protein